MKLTYPFFIVFSFLWSIGLQGLTIPENGYVLSTAGTGIATGDTPSLNPALNISKHSYIQFSLNQWIGDIKGSSIIYNWGSKVPQVLSIQSWNAKDLELWDETSADNPLGTFGVYYISASYGISHHLNTPYRFGVRIQTIYTHLFTESISGITLDAGTLIPLNSLLAIGGVIKNLGYVDTNGLRAKLPMEIGLGTRLDLPFNIAVLSDAIYLAEKGIDIRFGVRTQWEILNVYAGTSLNEKRNAQALGFSLNYRKWLISYGVYFHENTILGPVLPQFLDVRRYL